MSLGSRIRDAREIAPDARGRPRGISQEELATRCGVSRKTISAIERDTRQPSLDVLRAIARALSVTPAELGAWILED